MKTTILPLLKCWTLWYAVVLLCMPLLLLASEPATQPADRDPQEPEPMTVPADGVVRLPDGREFDLAELRAQGGMITVMRRDDGDGEKHLTINEDDREITIDETEQEVVVSIKEAGGEPKEFRAATPEDLEQNHPEAFEVYQKYAGDMMMQLPDPGMGQMGQFRVALAHGPGGPMGRFGVIHIEALGVHCLPIIDPFARAQLGDGVAVERVSRDSVAERIGLERHDLIKSINDQEVTMPDELQDAVENTGDPLKIEIVRKGQPMTLSED